MTLKISRTSSTDKKLGTFPGNLGDLYKWRKSEFMYLFSKSHLIKEYRKNRVDKHNATIEQNRQFINTLDQNNHIVTDVIDDINKMNKALLAFSSVLESKKTIDFQNPDSLQIITRVISERRGSHTSGAKIN